ncbi:hypothetical protein [Novosphingobium kaempferiae]|uniref:hypothetical protein n=1 Tax=Novosphingobium kaempferiae TaxID=2896849 RepID=UPI001E5DFC06|nr:hypothetical protein [Novosphingobium kaempferiae]
MHTLDMEMRSALAPNTPATAGYATSVCSAVSSFPLFVGEHGSSSGIFDGEVAVDAATRTASVWSSASV